MSDWIISLVVGIVIAFTGIGIGFYGLFSDKSGKIVIPLMVVLGGIGCIIIAISAIEQNNEDQSKQQIIKNQIESMSCNQLHDALLHNTINGTDHIQRATERYVAGCETK